MFTKLRGEWDFIDLRWRLIHYDLCNELSWQVRGEDWDNAYLPIARLAAWPSREAIKKDIKKDINQS